MKKAKKKGWTLVVWRRQCSRQLCDKRQKMVWSELNYVKILMKVLVIDVQFWFYWLLHFVMYDKNKEDEGLPF
jgi:hypothetical protein